MLYLKKNTGFTGVIGPFLDNEDGYTAETGLSLTQADIRISKNGSAFAQKNESTDPTHNELGWYFVALDDTDTNTSGQLMLHVNKPGALPVWAEFTVLPANVYDSIIGGTDTLESDIVRINGELTSGNNATLNLKKLNIINNNGDALVAVSTNGDGNGIKAVGSGAGSGLFAQSGNTGVGYNAGIMAVGNERLGSFGIYARGGGELGDAPGICAEGGSLGAPGIEAIGSAFSAGIRAKGGATGGAGIWLEGGDFHGPGAYITAYTGSDGGYGVKIVGLNNAGMSVEAVGTNSNGIEALGKYGAGVLFKSLISGEGILAIGGECAGDGIKAVGTSEFFSAHGIYAEGSSANGSGLYVIGKGTGSGIKAEVAYPGTGSAVYAYAPTGHGIHAASSYGDGIHGDAGSNPDSAGIHGKGFTYTPNAGIRGSGGGGTNMQSGPGIAAISPNITSGGLYNGGDGILVVGGSTIEGAGGVGIRITGGISEIGEDHGQAIKITSTGDAIHIQSGSPGSRCINIEGNEPNQSGIRISMTQYGSKGIDIGASNGVGVKVSATDAVDARGSANGVIIEGGFGYGAFIKGSGENFAVVSIVKDYGNGVGLNIQGSVGSKDISAKEFDNIPTLSTTVDGVSIEKIYEYNMAMANGKYKIDYPNPGDVTFYERNGETGLFTVHVTPTGRTRVE